MSSCLLSQAYGKHPQRWRGGTTEATIKPAATNTLPRRLAKPRCFLEKTGHSATQEGNHHEQPHVNRTTEQHRRAGNVETTPNQQRINRTTRRGERATAAHLLALGTNSKVVPLRLPTSASADDLPHDHTRTVQVNVTHHGFLRRVGAGCHAATPEGNPQRNQGTRHQTIRLVESAKEGLEEVLLVLAAQTLRCQHTTPRRRSEEAQQEMRERNGEFQAQRGTGRGRTLAWLQQHTG